jgi:hypothetical protein
MVDSAVISLGHQVIDRTSPNLSASELLPGLLDGGSESFAAALPLPITDDLDQILLLLFRQAFDHLKDLLKNRGG